MPAARSVVEIHRPDNHVFGDEREDCSGPVFSHVFPRDGTAVSPLALQVVDSSCNETEDAEGDHGHQPSRRGEGYGSNHASKLRGRFSLPEGRCCSGAPPRAVTPGAIFYSDTTTSIVMVVGWYEQ